MARRCKLRRKTLERKNLTSALERTVWQVAGEGGAAKLMDMKPTTLGSRMKAPGIKPI
jgi:formate hydrogenlyase transcriptional activator